MALNFLLARTTRLDRLVILLLLALAAVLFAILAGRSGGERLVAEQAGRVVFTASLQAEQTVALEGPLGSTVLEIAGGQARILASPCPHKDCMAMGTVSRRGALLACVPNRLLVRIAGGEAREGDYDLLSR